MEIMEITDVKTEELKRGVPKNGGKVHYLEQYSWDGSDDEYHAICSVYGTTTQFDFTDEKVTCKKCLLANQEVEMVSYTEYFDKETGQPIITKDDGIEDIGRLTNYCHANIWLHVFREDDGEIVHHLHSTKPKGDEKTLEIAEYDQIGEYDPVDYGL